MKAVRASRRRPPLAGRRGRAPLLLAASPQALVIVMTDLGAGPSLADLLLGADADAAEDALLGWTRSCGELAVATAGREPEFAALLAANSATGHDCTDASHTAPHWLERRIGEIPWAARRVVLARARWPGR